MNRFFALLFGLGLLAAAFYCARQELELRRHGVVATGLVVDARDVHEITYDTRHGIDSNTEHKGVVEFTPEGASKPLRFSASLWLRQTVGREVKVRYDSSDPAHAEVDGWSNWLLPLLLGLVGGACLLYVFGIVDGDGIEDSGQRWTLFRWFD